MTPRAVEQRRRVVIVEDDPAIVLGLRMNLEAEGYEVLAADDGAAGLEQVRQGCDLVILDLMLPNVNGFEVLKTLRAEGNTTPVIVLSARSAELDKVTGLELGADDYVTKPFSLAELLARVRLALRRREAGVAEQWRFGSVVVDQSTREVTRAGKPVPLTKTEFDVLEALCRAKGRVLPRERIFSLVWGPGYVGTLRTVDNFIAQLRAKLEGASAPRHLLTVRGIGYRLVP